ncbi:Pimeloyl-ACP methyl ester carboxylesterase [Filimonas lacunae]|uniref:Pimeloyl-ACP methyl ester carboxylesterase n=2 Tax=Filimonas lacunae TaxID=477680 RepID=A0A173MBV6_9BACT|nr:2-hydroxy-6-oxo-6-phenylhexa-2,4-dienoate hydrolase [Filimonas lacunae]SIT33663.1 Pimeloyl-ACP methyl ester carboxylesterase [Filimonas lacunae]
MILLHGLFGRLSNWETVIDHFKTSYDIHVPALPIFDSPPKADQLLYLTSFLDNYIQQHCLKDVILIGNSLGGHVAILYASLHGDKVKELVLTGSSGLYENTNIGAFPRRSSYDYIRERVAYTFYNPAMATEELVLEVMEVTTDSAKCLCTIRMAKSAQRNYVADLLPGIEVPVWLIWGKEDKVTPVHVAYEFADLLPHAHLTVFDECGHVPMMEKPDHFNAVLSSYLRVQKTN